MDLVYKYVILHNRHLNKEKKKRVFSVAKHFLKCEQKKGNQIEKRTESHL